MASRHKSECDNMGRYRASRTCAALMLCCASMIVGCGGDKTTGTATTGAARQAGSSTVSDYQPGPAAKLVEARAHRFSACANAVGLPTKFYGQQEGAQEVVGIQGGKGFEKFSVHYYTSASQASQRKALIEELTRSVTPALHVEQFGSALLSYDDSTPEDAVVRARRCAQT